MSILDQMRPVLEMEGFKQVGMVLNSVLDMLNENIQAMQGEPFTVEDVFTKVPALQHLSDALGLNSNTLQSLLVAPIKNVSAFAEILSSEEWREEFCEKDNWHDVLEFPVDFNTTALYAAFCQEDINTLLTKLQSDFNVEQTILSLTDGKPHFEDWKNATLKIFKLIENVETLIDNPPIISSEQIMDLLNENYNLDTLMELASAFSALQGNLMDDDAIYQPLSNVFKIARVMVDFINELMARVRLQNGRLDLASLFSGAPEFQKLVISFLGTTPDPVTGLFGVQLHSEKVGLNFVFTLSFWFDN